MTFEVKARDLLGRIGKLETKSGTIETPHMYPVVNPLRQAIPPRDLQSKFNCTALMTNSYILYRNLRERALDEKIHKLLDFDAVIATDSGGYQILEYGRVDVTPAGIVRFQEEIGTDIGVILDVPTGSCGYEEAQETVEETVRRADEALGIMERNDTLWVGPIQGGPYLDLVAKSAREMDRRNFPILALGSPTPIMEQYRFETLADMILTAKGEIHPSKPLHLFGAGHPVMMAFAVALGCDLFDSAAYALFARESRYLTSIGTLKLEDLDYFPCSCEACMKRSPQEVRDLPAAEREQVLAEHNLRVCFQEIQTIKQAISEGRLWRLLEVRARSHPALTQGLRSLKNHVEQLGKDSPSTKKKGLFIFDGTSLIQPELHVSFEALLTRYTRPKEARILLLAPTGWKHKTYHVKQTVKVSSKHHTVYYGPPLGVVPEELKGTFPFGHVEFTEPPDTTILRESLQKFGRYLETHSYPEITFLLGKESWQRLFATRCRKVAWKKHMKLRIVRM